MLLPFFHSFLHLLCPPRFRLETNTRSQPPYVRVRAHVKALVQVHGGRAPCSLQKNCTRRKRLGCGKVTQHHESLDRRCQTPIPACTVVLDALAACTRIKWLTTVVPICSLPSPFLSVNPASPLRIAENIFN